MGVPLPLIFSQVASPSTGRFPCPKCDRSYTRRDEAFRHVRKDHFNLKRGRPRRAPRAPDQLFVGFMEHLRAEYPGRGADECPLCDVRFAGIGAARRHIRNTHFLGREPKPKRMAAMKVATETDAKEENDPV